MAPLDSDTEVAEDAAMAVASCTEQAAEGPREGAFVGDALPGPPAVTVQFRWGIQTFQRTERMQCGRYVYQARGSVDGKGGLTLGYSEQGGGSWELGSSSGGCLYSFQTNAVTPAALVGNHPWERRAGGGTSHIIVMQSAATESGGWIDPALLAFDKKW
mmetsp:Transcript_84770/g.263727  ORF Transcript_84770/g.263727 Transcript_84770/m.263727 type:complete len:159 (-) Transcript_84770:14-490(-)